MASRNKGKAGLSPGRRLSERQQLELVLEQSRLEELDCSNTRNIKRLADVLTAPHEPLVLFLTGAGMSGEWAGGRRWKAEAMGAGGGERERDGECEKEWSAPPSFPHLGLFIV
jgi:hypothetical protein